MRYVNDIVVLCVLFFFIPIAALAGSLDDPGAPTTAGGGAMNTLEDIYNIINAGTTNAPRTGTFTEPSAGPASTGHTLTEVYNRAKTSSRPAETGQTICYDAAGTPITCTGTGQDGDKLKGVSWPSSRFTNNSDGTVTDNMTGLIWLQNANVPAATRTWTQALPDVAQLNTDGTMNGNSAGDTSGSGGSHQTDWRLPNVKELRSLTAFAFFNPALSDDAGTGKWTNATGSSFTGVQSATYWSSTTYTGITSRAWYVSLYDGIAGYQAKTAGYYVWPVRGGQ